MANRSSNLKPTISNNEEARLKEIESKNSLDMSVGACNNPSDSDSSSSSNSNDEHDVSDGDELDILSINFDPYKALYCQDVTKVKNIVPDAPVLDNVATFESMFHKKKSQSKQSAKGKLNTDNSESFRESDEMSASAIRNFTPDQMPIVGTKKELNNVLKFMKKQGDVKGPMSTLQTCIETGRRIKVIIRGMFSTIRLISCHSCIKCGKYK